MAAIPLSAAGGSGDGPGDRVRELQRLLLRMGKARFGPPAPGVEARIRAIADLARLEKLCDQILMATSWGELLSEQ